MLWNRQVVENSHEAIGALDARRDRCEQRTLVQACSHDRHGDVKQELAVGALDLTVLFFGNPEECRVELTDHFGWCRRARESEEKRLEKFCAEQIFEIKSQQMEKLFIDFRLLPSDERREYQRLIFVAQPCEDSLLCLQQLADLVQLFFSAELAVSDHEPLEVLVHSGVW